MTEWRLKNPQGKKERDPDQRTLEGRSPALSSLKKIIHFNQQFHLYFMTQMLKK